MSQIRTLTTGRPTWEAAKGSCAYDPDGPHLWVNFDGSFGWERIEGLGKILAEAEATTRLLVALGQWLIVQGFNELPEGFVELLEEKGEKAWKSKGS